MIFIEKLPLPWKLPSMGYHQKQDFIGIIITMIITFFVILCLMNYQTLHNERNLPLPISSVNVAKSAENYGFGHVYWEIFNGKLNNLCSKN